MVIYIQVTKIWRMIIMNCKDSDVFALEGYVEKALSSGEWKDSSALGKSIKSIQDESYQNKILCRSVRYHFSEEYAEEVFMDNVMDRLCTLFPMKYKKKNVFSHIPVPNSTCETPKGKCIYKRSWGFDQ